MSIQSIKILVTRPNPGGEKLCQLIRCVGDEAIHIPSIAFAESKIDNQDILKNFLLFDYVIFISPQAVYKSIGTIRQQWPHLPQQLKFVAVGAGTKQALTDAGINAITPQENFGSEGLLALPEFQQIHHKKVLIIKGEGGRELLEQELTKRDAEVILMPVYQRILPTLSSSEREMLEEAAFDVIIATSFEAIRNLKLLVSNAAWETIKTIPLIAVSERIIMLSQKLRFESAWVTKEVSNESILEKITELRDELWKLKRKK